MDLSFQDWVCQGSSGYQHIKCQQATGCYCREINPFFNCLQLTFFWHCKTYGVKNSCRIRASVSEYLFKWHILCYRANIDTKAWCNYCFLEILKGWGKSVNAFQYFRWLYIQRPPFEYKQVTHQTHNSGLGQILHLCWILSKENHSEGWRVGLLGV